MHISIAYDNPDVFFLLQFKRNQGTPRSASVEEDINPIIAQNSRFFWKMQVTNPIAKAKAIIYLAYVQKEFQNQNFSVKSAYAPKVDLKSLNLLKRLCFQTVFSALVDEDSGSTDAIDLA